MLPNCATIGTERNTAEPTGTQRNVQHPPASPAAATAGHHRKGNTMGITKTELRGILDETDDNEVLRSRIEELAKTSKDRKDRKELREFLDMVTRLNTALADAAGVKPRTIDPTATEYRMHTDDGLVYRVGNYFIGVNASREYQGVASLEVFQKRWCDEIASFRVKPLGPEGAVALAVTCIDHLNSQKPE